MRRGTLNVDFTHLDWEPNFRRATVKWWRPLPRDRFGNIVWFCNKRDLFPIRAVLDESWKQIVGILCWNYEKCRVCENNVTTSFDETEFDVEESDKKNKREEKSPVFNLPRIIK